VVVIAGTLPPGLTQTYDPDGTWDGQTTAVIAGGIVTTLGGNSCSNCDYNADFGYRYAGTLSISGTVFYDVGGLTDTTADVYTPGADTPYSDTVVYLWNASGILIGSTSTNINGAYTFANLPDGDYTVTMDDNAIEFADMKLTAVGIYDLDNSHSVSTSGGNVTDVDFGFFHEWDFCDLPDSYSTLLASGGPYHITSTLRLGNSVSVEDDGQESSDALGDDDDGVRRDPDDTWTAGVQVNLIITTTGGTGRLAGWFDWNQDGTFDQFVDFGGVYGDSQIITLTVGSYYPNLYPYVFARFRLFDPTNLPGGSLDAGDYVGAADNGEVEDYRWQFSPTAVDLQSFGNSSVSSSSPFVWLGALVVLVLAALSLLVVRRRRVVRVPIHRSE
jgi:hypothetical protein